MRRVPSPSVSAVSRPIAPANLAVTVRQFDEEILNWSDVSGDTGYRVERSADGGANWTVLASLPANTPSYTDDGLGNVSAYTYRVIPLSPYGDGPATTPVHARLTGATGLQFTAVATNHIDFQWNSVSEASGYRIDRSTDGINYSTLPTVTNTSYSDPNVTPLGEYYYRVTGFNTSTQSAAPTGIFAAVPAATPLPGTWLAQDIGSVGGPGATGYANGTFTVVASGADIWGTADSFDLPIDR